MATITKLDRLMKHLSHWAWVHRFYQYDRHYLLVADKFFLTRVRNARAKPLACKAATSDDFRDAITPDIKKVLVFCAQDELAIVKSIQTDFPHVEVTSGTYGFACNDAERHPRLVEYQSTKLQRETGTPVVMISTPNSDAEFIAKEMQRSGMPYCHEYLGRANGTWLEYHEKFEVARFYGEAKARYAKDTAPSFLLQTDVLEQVFKYTNFSLPHLLRYLKKTGAKVILVKRNDVAMSAVFGQILDRTAERSIWTKKNEQKKIVLKLLPEDLPGCFDRMAQAQRGETLLAELAQSLGGNATTITLEDFVEDQASGLETIAKLLGTEFRLPEAVASYSDGFETVKGLLDETLEFKRLMIDKFGLHAF